jgi:hypothetical protein
VVVRVVNRVVVRVVNRVVVRVMNRVVHLYRPLYYPDRFLEILPMRMKMKK